MLYLLLTTSSDNYCFNSLELSTAELLQKTNQKENIEKEAGITRS